MSSQQSMHYVVIVLLLVLIAIQAKLLYDRDHYALSDYFQGYKNSWRFSWW